MTKYLQFDVVFFIICTVVVLSILSFLQQEYVLIPMLNNQDVLTETLKKQILEQFHKYRWFTFIISPLVVFLRISLSAVCFFIGCFIFDSYGKMNYSFCFNIALKSDIVLLAYSVFYNILVVIVGYETATNIAKHSSFLGLFDIAILDPWLIALIGAFNVFELLYWLFLAKLLSVSIQKSYRDSLNFVVSTYGVGFFLYLLFLAFFMLYTS
jgi:hypothetical protein